MYMHTYSYLVRSPRHGRGRTLRDLARVGPERIHAQCTVTVYIYIYIHMYIYIYICFTTHINYY